METHLPLPPLIYRSIGIHHWKYGLSQFDGAKPIKVFISGNKYKKWVSSIEKYESKIMCITRYNGTIKEMFDSALLTSY